MNDNNEKVPEGSKPNIRTANPESVSEELKSMQTEYRQFILSLNENSMKGISLNLMKVYPDTDKLETLKEQVDDLKKCLDSFRPLSPAHAENLRQAFDTEYTYDSNRMEGNSLTLQETDLVIREGLTIGGKPLKDHLEAINHKDALEFVRELAQGKQEITESILLDIHGMILRGIDRTNAGRYRSDRVRISGSQHICPNPLKVPDLMQGYFQQYAIEKNTLHPVVLAAGMHKKLVAIHPFIDGNGRTARLIMNFILLQNGYPVANISGDKSNRKEYYNSLEKAHVENDDTDFIKFILKTEKKSLIKYLDMMEPDIEHGKGGYYLEKIRPFLKESDS
jgi:Fic family protein